MEHLGLQLRASQSENLRLKQELMEARKEPSRYGTPEEKPSSHNGTSQFLEHVGMGFSKERGGARGRVQRPTTPTCTRLRWELHHESFAQGRRDHAGDAEIYDAVER